MVSKQFDTLLEQILEDEGSYTDSNTLNLLLAKILKRREIKEEEISNLLIHIINDNREWHVEDLIKTIQTIIKPNWFKVYEHFDSKDLKLTSKSFSKIIMFWEHIAEKKTFPFHLFFTQWKNKEIQEQILLFYIENKENLIDIRNNTNLEPIIPDLFYTSGLNELSSGSSTNISPGSANSSQSAKSASNLSIESITLEQSHFNCIDLFRCLAGRSKKVTEVLLKKIVMISQDWAFLGLSTISPVQRCIFDEIFMMNLKKENFGILGYLAVRDPQFLIQCLSEVRDNGFSLNKCLDITLELKLLPAILDSLDPAFFCLEILILSSKRDHLNLNIWITNTFKVKGDSFIQIMIEYITEKLNNKMNTPINSVSIIGSENMEKQLYPLTSKIIHSIIGTFNTLFSQFSNENQTAFTILKKNIPLDGNLLESHANMFLTQIIENKISISEAIIKLQHFKTASLSEREQSNKILSLVADNFMNFYRINSKTLAEFTGGLLATNTFTSQQKSKIYKYFQKIIKNTENELQNNKNIDIMNISSSNNLQKKNVDINNLDQNNLFQELSFCIETILAIVYPSTESFCRLDFTVKEILDHLSTSELISSYFYEKRKNFLIEEVFANESTFEDMLDSVFESSFQNRQYLIEDSLSYEIQTIVYSLNDFNYEKEFLKLLKLLLIDHEVSQKKSNVTEKTHLDENMESLDNKLSKKDESAEPITSFIRKLLARIEMSNKNALLNEIMKHILRRVYKESQAHHSQNARNEEFYHPNVKDANPFANPHGSTYNYTSDPLTSSLSYLNNFFLLFNRDFSIYFTNLVKDILVFARKNTFLHDISFFCALGHLHGTLYLTRNTIFTLDQLDLHSELINSLKLNRVKYLLHYLLFFFTVESRIFRKQNVYFSKMINCVDEVGRYLNMGNVIEKKLYQKFLFDQEDLQCTNGCSSSGQFNNNYEILPHSVQICNCFLPSSSFITLSVRKYIQKKNLAQYKINYTGTVKSVIGMAIDFSIREVMQSMSESILNIVWKTYGELVGLESEKNSKEDGHDRFHSRKTTKSKENQSKKVGNSSDFVLNMSSRINLVNNLITALIQTSFPEPLLSALIGNIPYFLQFIPSDYINVEEIARENLHIAMSVLRNGICTIAIDIINKEERGQSIFKKSKNTESNYKKNKDKTKTTVPEPIYSKTQSSSEETNVAILSKFVPFTPTYIEKLTDFAEIQQKLKKISCTLPDKESQRVTREWENIRRCLEDSMITLYSVTSSPKQTKTRDFAKVFDSKTEESQISFNTRFECLLGSIKDNSIFLQLAKLVFQGLVDTLRTCDCPSDLQSENSNFSSNQSNYYKNSSSCTNSTCRSKSSTIPDENKILVYNYLILLKSLAPFLQNQFIEDHLISSNNQTLFNSVLLKQALLLNVIDVGKWQSRVKLDNEKNLNVVLETILDETWELAETYSNENLEKLNQEMAKVKISNQTGTEKEIKSNEKTPTKNVIRLILPPYEFVDLIEALSNLNEDSYNQKVYNLLKSVHQTASVGKKMIEKTAEEISLSKEKECGTNTRPCAQSVIFNIFEEYVKMRKYSFCGELYEKDFFSLLEQNEIIHMNKENEKNQNHTQKKYHCDLGNLVLLIFNSIQISFEHFIRHRKLSDFKFLYADCVLDLAVFIDKYCEISPSAVESLKGFEHVFDSNSNLFEEFMKCEKPLTATKILLYILYNYLLTSQKESNFVFQKVFVRILISIIQSGSSHVDLVLQMMKYLIPREMPCFSLNYIEILRFIIENEVISCTSLNSEISLRSPEITKNYLLSLFTSEILFLLDYITIETRLLLDKITEYFVLLRDKNCYLFERSKILFNEELEWSHLHELKNIFTSSYNKNSKCGICCQETTFISQSVYYKLVDSIKETNLSGKTLLDLIKQYSVDLIALLLVDNCHNPDGFTQLSNLIVEIRKIEENEQIRTLLDRIEGLIVWRSGSNHCNSEIIALKNQISILENL